MQAWQINSYGDISQLKLIQEASIPTIQKPTDVLVKVQSASVNPLDELIISGYGRQLFGYIRKNGPEFPLTLGRDFAGTVIEKGPGVSEDIKIGDEVFGIIMGYKQGSFAETVLCTEETIAHKPKNITNIEATSIAYAAMTAWSALYLNGNLANRNKNKAPQDTIILILGASGGVGTAAIQILKSDGFTVVAVCSKDAIPLVKSLGADQIFDYKDKDYHQNVAQAGNYDIILDCAQFGYQNVPNTWKYKRFVTLNSPVLINTDKYGVVGGMAMSAKDLLVSNFPKFMTGKSVRWGFITERKDGLIFISKLMENQQIKPVIHKVYKFDEIPAAFEELSKGHMRGKIVIDFN